MIHIIHTCIITENGKGRKTSVLTPVDTDPRAADLAASPLEMSFLSAVHRLALLAMRPSRVPSKGPWKGHAKAVPCLT